MERPYTTSVDLWAAGVVTYEFLLGHSPFRRHVYGYLFRTFGLPHSSFLLHTLPRQLLPTNLTYVLQSDGLLFCRIYHVPKVVLQIRILLYPVFFSSFVRLSRNAPALVAVPKVCSYPLAPLDASMQGIRFFSHLVVCLLLLLMHGVRYRYPELGCCAVLRFDGCCAVLRFDVLMCSESGGADTLSRIERGSYAFPEEPLVSAEARDFVSRVSRGTRGSDMYAHVWFVGRCFLFFGRCRDACLLCVCRPVAAGLAFRLFCVPTLWCPPPPLFLSLLALGV